MNRIGKTIVVAAITGSLVVMPVSAAPDIDAIKQEKAQTQQAIDSTSNQLTQLLTEFEILKGDLRNQEAAIQKADEDLKVAQKKEQKQYEEMMIRIKYMYEKGEGSELAALLGSGSFTELLNRAEYIQNVHTYDREQLEEYAKVKEQVAQLKSGLEEEKKQMEALADVYSAEEKSLQSTLSTMRSQMATLTYSLQKRRSRRRKKQDESKKSQNRLRKNKSKSQKGTLTAALRIKVIPRTVRMKAAVNRLRNRVSRTSLQETKEIMIQNQTNQVNRISRASRQRMITNRRNHLRSRISRPILRRDSRLLAQD